MATIDYVEKNGVTYGKQLIGSVLFFVPRLIWPNKPLGSGQLIGNYLMENYSMWFNNVSNPLPSEGYINFGLIGVMFFGFLLSKIGHWVEDLKQNYGWVVYLYISNHMIFILRGDLLSSLSYLIGILFALLIFPKFIDIIFNKRIKLKI